MLRRAFSSLAEPLAGFEAVQAVEASLSATMKTSSLANGLRVVSVDIPSAQVSSVVYVSKGGSRLENDSNSGLSHIIQALAFRSSKQRSALRVSHALQSVGASAVSVSGREYMAVGGESLRPDCAVLVEALSDTVHGARLTDFEVAEVRRRVAEEGAILRADPHVRLLEEVYATAFPYNTLGFSSICPAYNVEKIDAQEIRTTRQRLLSAKNSVLVGLNVDHEAFVQKLAASELSAVSDGQLIEFMPSKYVGGEKRLPTAATGHVAFALAFAGRKEDADVLRVAAKALGGRTASVHACSRRNHYQSLLSSVDSARMLKTQVGVHSDAALLVVCGEAESSRVDRVIRSVAQQVGNVGAVTEGLVSAAKVSAALDADSNRLRGFAQAEALGAQSVLGIGGAGSAVKVTVDGVRKCLETLLASSPTYVVIGDTVGAPSLSSLKF